MRLSPPASPSFCTQPHGGIKRGQLHRAVVVSGMGGASGRPTYSCFPLAVVTTFATPARLQTGTTWFGFSGGLADLTRLD